MIPTEDAPASVMVVDDTPENVRLLVHALSGAGYRVRAAVRGEHALRMAKAEPPDVFLLDVDMPEMDGFQLCETLLAVPSLSRVPVLFISALHEQETKARAFGVGARDYVTKPFNMVEVLARVQTQVKLHRFEQQARERNVRLQQRIDEQVKEISDAQHAIISALATLTESRDDCTGLHVARIAEMSHLLARGARSIAGLAIPEDGGWPSAVARAATLHDIGKVGIPDAILLKPGRLTPDEFAVMKTHTTIGARTLTRALESHPRSTLIRLAADIAQGHHERWDGKGYPAGIAGETIPLSARLVAVADVYDALRSSRPYKAGWSHADAMRLVREGAGTQFDPRMVDAFDAVEGALAQCFATMSDPPPPPS